MPEESTEPAEHDESQRPAAHPGPMPPLFGTKESAAGLPFAPTDTELDKLLGVADGTRVELATPRQRLKARLLDIIIVGVLLAIVQGVVWFIIFTSDPALRRFTSGPLTQREIAQLQEALTPYALWVPTLVLLVVWFLYEVPSVATRGQTLGKLALGIRVVPAGPVARPIGWTAAAIRWAVLGLPTGVLGGFALPLQLIDCAWLLRDPENRQCLHDKAARSRVVHVDRKP